MLHCAQWRPLVDTHLSLLQVGLLCHLHCLFDLLVGAPLSVLRIALTGSQRRQHGRQLIPLPEGEHMFTPGHTRLHIQIQIQIHVHTIYIYTYT